MLCHTPQRKVRESCLLESLRRGWYKGANNSQQLVAQWLGFLGFTTVAWVQFLARELRSHKPHGAAKKGKTTLLPSVPSLKSL